MKFTRNYYSKSGINYPQYVSENGYTIRKTQHKNMFTGKVMSEQIWEIFDSSMNRVTWELTLKDAKHRVEVIAQEVEK